MRSILGLIFLIAVSGTQLGYAQSLSITGPTDSLRVGDTFSYTITLKSSTPYQKVLFPDSTFFLGDLEYLNRQQFKVSDYSDSTAYTLQYFGTDDANIPSLPVSVIGEDGDTLMLYTQPLMLNFKTVLATSEEEESFKPIKPNYLFERLWWPWLLAFALLAILAYILYKKYYTGESKETKVAVAPPVFENPIELLEEQLHSIKDQHQAATEKDFKWFYSEVGDSIRKYYEELYNIPALESTTREVIRFLNSFGVDDELIKITHEVLMEADMVKFAKMKPTLDQSLQTFHQAHSFLDRAKVVDIQRIQHKREQFEAQFLTPEVEDGMG